MAVQYRSYYKLFTFRFLIKAFVVRAMRLYARELKLLDIADELAARGITVQRLDGRKIRLAVNINQTRLDIVLRKNTSDLLVFDQVLLKRAYQPLLALVNRHFQGEVKIIVDVGSNVGLTSLFLRCYFDVASIFAIEPSPGSFSILEENLKANVVKAEASRKALMAVKGRVRIDNSFRDKQDWSTQVVPTGLASDIEAVPLTDFMHENQISVIDILKIDIEGHEAELFASKEFISALKYVRFLALEIHEEKADRISVINELQAQGFMLLYKGETVFGFNPAVL